MLQLAEDLTLGRGLLSLRIDIHEENEGMRRLLERRGYARCGAVTVPGADGRETRRIGYEKKLT